jgi:hypothetical protein
MASKHELNRKPYSTNMNQNGYAAELFPRDL